MDHYQPFTPPAVFNPERFNVSQWSGGSDETSPALGKHESGNDLLATGTDLTTPPISPQQIRELGPALLPRVRRQDWISDSSSTFLAAPSSSGHLRTTSLPALESGGLNWGRTPSTNIERPSPTHLSGNLQLLTPPFITNHDLIASDQVSPLAGSSLSATSARGHSRNSSSASIDPSILARHGYPTYRQSPTPQPMSGGPAALHTRTASAISHLAPIAMPDGQVQSYPRRRTVSPPASRPSQLSHIHDEGVTSQDVRVTCLLDYLTAPNPKPSVTRRIADPIRSVKYFWFDVRNVRSWDDFNVETLTTIPRMLDLLQIQISAKCLPTPGPVNTSPETQAHLAQLCAIHHAVKVNAALRVSLGEQQSLSMQCLSAPAGRHHRPEFVAHLPTDFETTPDGDRRGRVVGIVKCFDQWNSGQRNMGPAEKVRYLQGLAQLQHFMRRHGTRYGFIITEIELVCVRAGGPPPPAAAAASSFSQPTAWPAFGYLEVAAPIGIETDGPAGRDGALRWTADLALWYLHMLAKEQRLPGQPGWRMEVGAPAALSRQAHCARDAWIEAMNKPINVEVRQARKDRGWVWPDEPFSRKEHGTLRRVRRQVGA